MAAPQFPFVEQVRGEWETAKGYIAEGLEQLNAGLQVWAPAGTGQVVSNTTFTGNATYANTAGYANSAGYAAAAGAALFANTADAANTALLANDSTYAFGKAEGALNVNSALAANTSNTALTANNSTYAFGKTEGALNVNSALAANTSNDTAYFGGQLPAFYTNSSNANTGTLPDARLSANVVLYTNANTQNKVLATPDGASGNLVLRALAANDVFNLDRRWTDINRNGFLTLDGSDTTLSFNDSTYVFTLGNTAATWTYMRGGKLYTISGSKTVTLPGSPPTAGEYYIYIDANDGTLSVGTSVWNLTDQKVAVAKILWNNTLTPKYWMGDERHTAFLDTESHRYFHSTFGTRYSSGGALTGPVAGSSDVNNCFAVAQTVIRDEDLVHTLAALSAGDGTTNTYAVFTRSNTSFWVWSKQPVPYAYTANGYIQYDANGTMTQGAAIKYYNYYLMFSNLEDGADISARYLLVPGRSEFSTLAAAQAEDPTTFDWTGFEIDEGILAYRITWATNPSYANKGKAQWAATQRISLSIGSGTASPSSTTHNMLAGLQGGAPNEYYHLTALQANTLTNTAAMFLPLDSIASQFTGAQTVFTLKSSNAAVYPSSPHSVFVQLGGVPQEPNVAFTISGSSITFTSAPANGETFFGRVLAAPFALSSTPKKLDSIASQFNSSQTVFGLAISGVAVSPPSAENLILVINSVLQEPTTAYTVSGNAVTFTSAPPSNATFFGTLLGEAVTIGTITPGVDINPRNITATGNVIVGTAWAHDPSYKLIVRKDGAANTPAPWAAFYDAYWNRAIEIFACMNAGQTDALPAIQGSISSTGGAKDLLIQPNGGNVTFGNSIFERARTTAMGEWISPTFSNTNFTGYGAMTWNVESGDVTTYAYTLIGKTMTVAFTLLTTSVGGTPNSALNILIPGGFTAAKTMYGQYLAQDAGAALETGFVRAIAGDTKLYLYLSDATNWAAATNSTSVYGHITFEVQ